MESTFDWSIPIILWLQQFSPALDLPFKFFSLLGEETFFLLFLPGLYWSVDRRVGARLALLFFFSACLNFIAKAWADQPRPFEYNVRVRQLVQVPAGGLPSGHAQNAVVVWGYLAIQFRQVWLWWLAGLLIIFISLSRLYLGVHFPIDLLGGYLLGVALLAAYWRLEPSLEAWLQARGLIWQLGLALSVSCLLLLLLATEDGVAISAAMLGMSLGIILERRLVGFEANGSWRQRVLRFLVGAAVMVALWLGLRLAFSSLEPALLFRFARYSLLGLWGAIGAPWLFVRLNWAEKGLAKQSTPLIELP
jgi:membrane-associated phospholipid phosphatase